MDGSHGFKHWGWSLLVLLTISCGGVSSTTDAPEPVAAALVGEQPVRELHVYENHSSALIAWRRAGARNLTLLHLDGHIDFNWLPDETVARIAAARPNELANLELHPYALDGNAHSRFAIWNFIYPASRLGVVSRLIWVVPDGTLADEGSVTRLGREVLLGRIQMVSLREAAGLVRQGRVLRGTLLDLPITVCELDDLPELDEPVLLDIDLDYFSTRSAMTQRVARRPWTMPHAVLETLRRKGVRTEFVTISLSTIGGYFPAASRWLGRELEEHLRHPDRPPTHHDLRMRAKEAEQSAETNTAIALYGELVQADPDDADAWYSLYRLYSGSGRREEASAAWRRAVALDPVLEHEDLFEGDRLWINREFGEALPWFERYMRRVPSSPFAAYATRRRAHCMWRLGRLDEAEAMFRRVLELAPDHADSHLNLGELLRERGRLDEALVEIQRARAILPRKAGYAWSLGSTYVMTGQMDEAIAQLSEAVQWQPCWAAVRGTLAVALLRRGRVDDAVAHLRAGLAIRPRLADLRNVANELQRRGVRVTPVTATPSE